MQKEISPIDFALRQFEATEANLEKLERVFNVIRNLIPRGTSFGRDINYDDQCRIFMQILDALPKIDGWKPTYTFCDLNEIAQSRLDAEEIGEPIANFHMDEYINEPSRIIAEYHFKLNLKRRQLIKRALLDCMTSISEILLKLTKKYDDTVSGETHIDSKDILFIQNKLDEIETLLGSESNKPRRWVDLQRHLHFGLKKDLTDIINTDWPEVNSWLSKYLYDRNEPINIEVEDLGELAKQEPQGSIVTSLNWNSLSPEDFERLIFTLISDTSGYENAEWLMRTNAPDKGRDLSVIRTFSDSLSGKQRFRILVQCKHWLSKSVNASDIATIREQIPHWEPPKVDVLIIATSGRFSAEAVSLIEKNNLSDKALKIEMWPESHIELILRNRPSLIAEFRLK